MSSPDTAAKSIDFAEGRINMKGIGLWAIGIGVLVSAGLLSVEPAYAGENDHTAAQCSLQTLRGQYLLATSGTLFPPAFGVTETSVDNAAGYSIYKGDGTGEDYVTFTVNGVNQNVTSPTPTTYTLNPDCTGTKTVVGGPHFNIFVAFDGSALTAINTDTGTAGSEFDRRTPGSE